MRQAFGSYVCTPLFVRRELCAPTLRIERSLARSSAFSRRVSFPGRSPSGCGAPLRPRRRRRRRCAQPERGAASVPRRVACIRGSMLGALAGARSVIVTRGPSPPARSGAGPSPRARGRHAVPALRRVAQRSIPASAGEPRPARFPADRVPVHPRERGGGGTLRRPRSTRSCASPPRSRRDTVRATRSGRGKRAPRPRPVTFPTWSPPPPCCQGRTRRSGRGRTAMRSTFHTGPRAGRRQRSRRFR